MEVINVWLVLLWKPGSLFLLSGHRGADRVKAVPTRAERKKQRALESGDPDYEEVRLTVTCINIKNKRNIFFTCIQNAFNFNVKLFHAICDLKYRSKYFDDLKRKKKDIKILKYQMEIL